MQSKREPFACSHTLYFIIVVTLVAAPCRRSRWLLLHAVASRLGARGGGHYLLQQHVLYGA
jgi:hypothetical protein